MPLLVGENSSNFCPWESEEVASKVAEAVSCSKVEESLPWGAV